MTVFLYDLANKVSGIREAPIRAIRLVLVSLTYFYNLQDIVLKISSWELVNYLKFDWKHLYFILKTPGWGALPKGVSSLILIHRSDV
jgi:hypothetical protein